jgi:hypothetical protein
MGDELKKLNDETIQLCVDGAIVVVKHVCFVHNTNRNKCMCESKRRRNKGDDEEAGTNESLTIDIVESFLF